MGNCQNCGNRIVLKNKENCPICGKNPYICWNCKEEISGKEKECKVCRFFRCSSCDQCGPQCNYELIKKDLKNAKNVNDIIDIVSDHNKGKKRYTCPRGIPKSVGETDLKNLTLKMKGYRISKENKEAYTRLFAQIGKSKEGELLKASDFTRVGEYQKRAHDMLRLSVCRGRCELSLMRDEKAPRVLLYKKKHQPPCEHQIFDKLVIKECTHCKKRYDESHNDFCDICVGKDNNSLRLKTKKAYRTFCQCPASLFKVSNCEEKT